MKILTLFGTRPEIIRLSLVVKQLDCFCDQILVHTGQNYDHRLSQMFLDDLSIRKLDHYLGVVGDSFGDQAGQILKKMDSVLRSVRPDRLLILGDTNSGLAAIVAARQGIPVYHMEAGNRCYDNRVPEEINRRIIDHCSDVLLPYTERSAANLVAEGIRRERIFVTGNPILEVLEHFAFQIQSSDVLERLALRSKEYFLVTLHRAENVDQPTRLRALLGGLNLIATHFGKLVVLSLHPRTEDRITSLGIEVDPNHVRLEKPFGLFDFINMEKNALAVLTDSGTVQEEACIFGIPNVTIRDVTERPETTECGSNILAGSDPKLLLVALNLAISGGQNWVPPLEYTKRNVANTVAKIVLGYRL